MRRRVGCIRKGKGWTLCENCEEGCTRVEGGRGMGDAEGSAFKKVKGYWETLGDEGDPDAHISSAKQLREVCKKKGLKAMYLENR